MSKIRHPTQEKHPMDRKANSLFKLKARAAQVTARLALLICIVPSTALAAIHEVHPGMSIQDAVNSSADYDTILIHDGSYTETVVLYGKTVAIGSLYLLDSDSAHVSATVIEPDFARPDTASVFVYAHEEQAAGRLVGLTITGGHGTSGWTTQAAFGGGIYVRSVATIEQCVIENCSADYGGGVSFDDTLQGISSGGVLRDCVIRNCSANSYGGGIRANHTSLLVVGCLIDGNWTGYLGGAEDLSGCEARMDSCTIRRNSGVEVAGVMWSDCIGTIQNCVFEENGGAEGEEPVASHLECTGQRTVITRCIFRNNVPGTISIFLYASGGDVPRLVGNVIENNVTTYITGTIAVFNGGGDLAYNLIRNNTNVWGGAVYVTDGSGIRIHHNWFEGNVSVDSTMPSAVLDFSIAYPTLDSNAFVGNMGPSVGWYVMPHEYPIIYAERNWWGHESGPYHPTLNPAGQGDTLLQDSIHFIPWLTSPPDTTMPQQSRERQWNEPPSTWRMVTIYPNPFNSEVNLVIAGFTLDDFEITLHNLLGQQVDVITRGAIAGGHIHYQATAALASGVYFVRASSVGRVETRKILLLR